HGYAIAHATEALPPRLLGPRKARARTDGSVCLSTQPPTDRSMQRLRRRRRCTAPALHRAARRRSGPRRRGKALERTLRLALPTPPPEDSRKPRPRCPLAVPLIPAPPQPPLGGSADR